MEREEVEEILRRFEERIRSREFYAKHANEHRTGGLDPIPAASGIGAPNSADYLVGTADAGLTNEIVVGPTPGGELGGSWASPTVDATHSGSTHSAAADTHIADTADAHDASAISADSTTLVGTGTDVQAVLEELDDAVALLTPHNLVSASHDGEQDYTNTLGLLAVGANDVLLYSDAGSTLTAQIDGATGHMGLATSAFSAHTVLVASETVTDPAAAKAGITGTIQSQINSSNANTVRGIAFAANVVGLATATQSGIVTAQRLTHASLASVGNLTVNDVRLLDVGALSAGANATITDLYQIRLLEPTGAGAVTNSYGIYIPAMTKGATLNIPILSLGGNSRHVGALTLGANAAATSGLILDVTGNVGLLNEGELRLYDSGSSNYIGIRSNNARTADLVYVLPATDPTVGQVLSASAPSAGVVTLSWADDATGAGAVATDTIWDAKGDLAAGTGANTAAVLTVGADDTILMADSGQATGLKWAAAATTTEIADVATTEAAGTSDTYARGDHAHKAAHSGIDTTSMKQSIMLTAAGGKPTTTSGCAAAAVTEAATNDVDYWSLAFDAAADEFAFWNLPMPGNYDPAVDMTAVFHWTTAASSGDVIWGIQALAVANDGAIDQAYGTAATVTDTFLAAGDVHISSATAGFAPGGSDGADRPFWFRVYRDADAAGDTLNGDALLLAVQIEYGVTVLSGGG